MHQLIDKKNKIILYLLVLFILSTTSKKFAEDKNIFSTKINRINIEGLSAKDNLKIYNELQNLFYKNILFIHKGEIQKIINSYNIIEEYNIKKTYPSTININIKATNLVGLMFIFIVEG